MKDKRKIKTPLEKMGLPDPLAENMRRVKDGGYEQNSTPLDRRGHSYRNYKPKDFIEYAIGDDNGLDEEKYVEARMVLRRMEGRRFHPMLDKISMMFSRLDPDEKKMFARKNPGLTKWIGVYGFLEELNTYEEYTGIVSVHKY